VPAWSLILIAMLVVTQSMNPTERDFIWYRTLKRPGWLKMHLWVPIAWLIINITFYIATLLYWDSTRDWRLVGILLVLLVLLRSHPWLICKLHSLSAGLTFWLISWVANLYLAITLQNISPLASQLLLPAVLWTPFEAAITFQMIGLNPRESRRGRGPDDRRPARSRRL
jgi:tryptophan-rich sensory protein